MRRRRFTFPMGNSWASSERRPADRSWETGDGVAAPADVAPDRPEPVAGGEPTPVTVAVLGSSSVARDLGAYLPEGWRVVEYPVQDGPAAPAAAHPTPDVVVLTGSSPVRVRDACRRFAGVPVLSTVAQDAAASEVIEVLRAGADACVRAEGPVLLSAHVRACYRRGHSALAPTAHLAPAPGTREVDDRAGRVPVLTGTGAPA